MKSEFRATVALLFAALPSLSIASPDMECGGPSQVEIGSCLAQVEETVDGVVQTTLGFALGSARELDEATGRSAAVPALEAAQAAWTAYRDTHCEFVGATFGGGSGTGIAIQSCRIELGRARARDLLSYAR